MGFMDNISVHVSEVLHSFYDILLLALLLYLATLNGRDADQCRARNPRVRSPGRLDNHDF